MNGFEVLGARYDGIKMNGDYNVVRNCWVHNNQAMGVAMHNQRGGVIENNLSWTYYRHSAGGTLPDLWSLPGGAGSSSSR